MKTAIVGGGRGCHSLLEFILERGLVELPLDVQMVCDLHSNAPGMVYAAKRGIATCSRIEEVLRIPGIELIIELTGEEQTSTKIQQLCPPGVRLMDRVVVLVSVEDTVLVEVAIVIGELMPRVEPHLLNVGQVVVVGVRVLDVGHAVAVYVAGSAAVLRTVAVPDPVVVAVDVHGVVHAVAVGVGPDVLDGERIGEIRRVDHDRVDTPQRCG